MLENGRELQGDVAVIVARKMDGPVAVSYEIDYAGIVRPYESE